MELASRLKIFIDYLGIQTTQFADACGIPRPSFSQLLNGRNKKVSDAVIRQIHEAYPSLSVMWLLFGEGDMVNGENIEFSEPQNPPETPTPLSETSDTQHFQTREQDLFQNVNNESEKSAVDNGRHFEKVQYERIAFPGSSSPVPPSVTSLNRDRKVVNIMVFYNDNSFETFIPKS